MENTKQEFIEQLRNRTKQVAIRIIKMYKEMPQEQVSWILGKQIVRSSTSMAANYRAACRARSSKEYFAKISIVIEEADETQFWLELLVDTEIFKIEKLQSLMNEVQELVAIFTKSRKTLSEKMNK